MGGVLALARKEASDILRERTIVMALATQLFVAAFSAFLTVGLVSLYDPSSVQAFPDSTLAYVGPGGFDDQLAGSDNIVVRRMNMEQALDQFRDGRVYGIVEETYTEADAARAVSLLLPEDEFRTTLVVNQLKEHLRDYERELRIDRQERLDQEVLYFESDADPDIYFDFAYSVLLPLLVATPVFLAGAITGDTFTQEINEKTLPLLRASPVSLSTIVAGKLLVPALLTPVQVALWVFFLELNGVAIANVHLILLAAFLLGLLLACLSVLLAVAVKKEGHVQAAYTVLVLVLSGGSLLLPRDPFNLIARSAVDLADTGVYVTLGVYALAALTSLWAAFWFTERQASRDAL